MFPDIRFEATFLRTGLLAGVLRESDAADWAEALLHSATEHQGQLAEVAIAPLELTAMREALRPLASEALALEAGAALLAFMALDPVAADLNVPDTLRVFSVLRREGALSAAAGEATKEFEDRHSLASVGVPGESGPASTELAAWLDAARPSALFRFSFEHDDEQAAFLAALSRVVMRERRSAGSRHGGPARGWTVEHAGHRRTSLVLNERLWLAALRSFSPLPIASRIPYLALPAGAVIVLEEESASSLGMNDATTLLANHG